MYICVCHGVTENELTELLDAGATTTKQVAAGCRAGTGCGSCVWKIRALLSESPDDRGKLAVGTTPEIASDGRLACEATGRSSSC